MKRKAIHPLDSNSSSLKIASINLNPKIRLLCGLALRPCKKHLHAAVDDKILPRFLWNLICWLSFFISIASHHPHMCTNYTSKCYWLIEGEKSSWRFLLNNFVFNSQIFQFANLFALEPIFSDLPVSCRVVEVFFWYFLRKNCIKFWDFVKFYKSFNSAGPFFAFRCHYHTHC